MKNQFSYLRLGVTGFCCVCLDFVDLSTFNAKLHRIVAQLRLYGEDVSEEELIDKTLSTFPPTSSILAQ